MAMTAKNRLPIATQLLGLSLICATTVSILTATTAIAAQPAAKDEGEAFVGENGSVNDIRDAVRMAARGESYCPPKLTACLIDHIASMARHIVVATPSRLTDREREVASMVGDGLSNKEIAGMLRISPATVKNHVHNILDKLDLPSRSAIGGRLEVTARAA